MVELDDASQLIKLARLSITARLEGKVLKIDDVVKEHFVEERGVFVTLKKDNQLRGCIGFPEPVMPLWEAVHDAALAAAFQDPRFPRLQRDEAQEITIELSILTLPKRIKIRDAEEYFTKIKIGRDGLILRAGVFSGLLLPQVPTEYGWNVEAFLRHLCLKANLPMDAWKNPNYEMFSFQAEVFAEHEPGGKVDEVKT
ncbi:TIGR00296 family protein [Candidatus Woesearchaeota archaeon]|nr:MAG: hypothetical protein QS99_C0010G0020 [archaeon GW2011_AR4]MBS3130251.1 TIGR00296 family protein [Candidatus Woesearchaeota archaeon]HIH38182.1 TIGR00296 family protein [Candidatus Woesearchaeota archaeon]HIH49477.1 TIGR00296 family protein [Candidatus Woesearchaeota archaeon]HIJ03859.1 TIGR00296 family protein [Candidatus Woesearchaeota archaeon]